MLAELKPYPDALRAVPNEPWLGSVPAHWTVARLKTVCRFMYGDSMSSDDRKAGSVKVYGSNGAVGHHDVANTLAPCIVIGRKGSFGKVNYSEQAVFAIDTTFFVDGRSTTHNIRWLAYVLGAIRLDVASRDSAIPGLDRNEAYARVVPLPPPAEQAGIVRFLGAVDRKVNRFIRAKRRLIEVLTEQKQAIITHAVTKGLSPHAPLKPSGIDWLGDVPEHWEVLDLRWLATKFGSGVTPKGGAQVYQSSGVPFLRSQNVHFNGLRLSGVAHIAPELHAELSGTHVKPYDVLLNITGASIGRACAVPPDFIDGNVNQHVCIIRPRRNRVNSEYLAAFLSTPAIQHEIYLSQNGSSREGLTLQAIRDLSVFVPPIEEQAEIINAVAARTRTVADAIAGAEREISLIREYRTRLVADVVTGKVDVRAAAASLPDDAAADDPTPDDHAQGADAEGGADAGGDEPALEAADAD